jgi:hypothetical protein
MVGANAALFKRNRRRIVVLLWHGRKILWDVSHLYTDNDSTEPRRVGTSGNGVRACCRTSSNEGPNGGLESMAGKGRGSALPRRARQYPTVNRSWT